MPLGREVGLSQSDIVLDGDPAFPPQKAAEPPNFRIMSIVASTAESIKMPLGREVGLSSSDIVLDRDPAAPHQKGTAAPLFSAHVYCGHGRPS